MGTNFKIIGWAVALIVGISAVLFAIYQLNLPCPEREVIGNWYLLALCAFQSIVSIVAIVNERRKMILY